MDVMTWLRAEWDRVLGFTLVALGAVLLVLGYLGVSDSPYVAEQLSYIVSGGLGGLFLLGAGATLLILADLHDEWRKLDRVEAMLSGEIPFPARFETNGHSSSSSPASVAAAKPAPAGAGPALMVEAPVPEPVPEPGPGAARSGPTAVAIFRRERFTLGIGMLLSVAVLFGSWTKASGASQAKPAIAALSIAVFGLLLVALGAVGSTLTVKRHVQLRKARLFAPWLAPDERPAAAPVGAGSLVVVPGLTRYHRAECPSVAGMAVRPVERRTVPSGLEPCHLCDAHPEG